LEDQADPPENSLSLRFAASLYLARYKMELGSFIYASNKLASVQKLLEDHKEEIAGTVEYYYTKAKFFLI
jgi:hypothetical protein